jgi:hypothetical protein
MVQDAEPNKIENIYSYLQMSHHHPSLGFATGMEIPAVIESQVPWVWVR